MSFEKPSEIPEENQLPLKITESKASEHQGREAALWEINAETHGDSKALALKEVRKEEFASMEEMSENRKFYEYLKNIPDFGKFVLPTLYFKARKSSEETPRAYRLQPLIKGKRLDEISDSELYSDPELDRQLLEFIDASIKAVERANKDNKNTPDLYGDKFSSVYLFNPRFSSNVMVADKPPFEDRQRIFLVDTNKQIRQVGVGKTYQKHIGSKLQLIQLKRWRETVESHVNG